MTKRSTSVIVRGMAALAALLTTALVAAEPSASEPRIVPIHPMSQDVEVLSGDPETPSPRDAAIGFCHGTPLRDEIEARGGTLERATDAAEEGIARRFGRSPVTARMQAHVVVVENGSRATG
jgi:hypothetical protein